MLICVHPCLSVANNVFSLCLKLNHCLAQVNLIARKQPRPPRVRDVLLVPSSRGQLTTASSNHQLANDPEPAIVLALIGTLVPAIVE